MIETACFHLHISCWCIFFHLYWLLSQISLRTGWFHIFFLLSQVLPSSTRWKPGISMPQPELLCPLPSWQLLVNASGFLRIQKTKDNRTGTAGNLHNPHQTQPRTAALGFVESNPNQTEPNWTTRAIAFSSLSAYVELALLLSQDVALRWMKNYLSNLQCSSWPPKT